mmetsp:Transcript_56846/g.146320  ORF Transcript_56846/g.146320 Transcript_56846/m.146320 type:complete len:236 (+) Transcript_56846:497-1204(+)
MQRGCDVVERILCPRTSEARRIRELRLHECAPDQHLARPVGGRALRKSAVSNSSAEQSAALFWRVRAEQGTVAGGGSRWGRRAQDTTATRHCTPRGIRCKEWIRDAVAAIEGRPWRIRCKKSTSSARCSRVEDHLGGRCPRTCGSAGARAGLPSPQRQRFLSAQRIRAQQRASRSLLASRPGGAGVQHRPRAANLVRHPWCPWGTEQHARRRSDAATRHRVGLRVGNGARRIFTE